MVEIFVWPDGSWAFKHEVWKPDPGFAVDRVSEFWPEDRVDTHVQQKIDRKKYNFPK